MCQLDHMYNHIKYKNISFEAKNQSCAPIADVVVNTGKRA